MNEILKEAEEAWRKLDELGTATLFFPNKEKYLQTVRDWESRDIPSADREQMHQDSDTWLGYCIAVLKGKREFNLQEAQELHSKVTRWKPESYPLKS